MHFTPDRKKIIRTALERLDMLEAGGKANPQGLHCAERNLVEAVGRPLLLCFNGKPLQFALDEAEAREWIECQTQPRCVTVHQSNVDGIFHSAGNITEPFCKRWFDDIGLSAASYEDCSDWLRAHPAFLREHYEDAMTEAWDAAQESVAARRDERADYRAAVL